MISIIIPAYNAAETIGACLAALLCQTGLAERYEVIVVDDGSTDGTAEVVRHTPAPVRLVTQPHRGAAAARNRGAVAAEGEILLFTDADCRPRPDWAAEMIRLLVDERVAGVKGLFRSDQRSLVARMVQAEYEEKEAQMLARSRVAFADTAAAGYRADVFRAVGGFRTDMQAVEDTELAFRLAAADYLIVVAPGAIVHHRHPEGVWAYARRKFRYGLWGVRAYLDHPERMADDSRTPWSMRLQLVLAPLAAMSLVAAPLGPAARWVAAGLGLAFAASVAPFVWRSRGHGWSVMSLALPLFFVRAMALVAGLSLGLARRVAGHTSPGRATDARPLAPLLHARPGEAGTAASATTRVPWGERGGER